MSIQEKILVFRLEEKDRILDLKNKADIKYFIADLYGVELELVKMIKDKLLIFAQSIKREKGLLVIVHEFSFDDELIIVPTIQEAYDYIEMEDIERQLEL